MYIVLSVCWCVCLCVCLSTCLSDTCSKYLASSVSWHAVGRRRVSVHCWWCQNRCAWIRQWTVDGQYSYCSYYSDAQFLTWWVNYC